mmetsp:Transcript_1783/g.3214  ORF Transcript_1783/g.3214 Transcript_1783/m.3214 type:complete len:191 (+) Transcript_1783:81-653(+)
MARSVESLGSEIDTCKNRLEEAEGTLLLKDSIISSLAPESRDRAARLDALREKLGLYKAQLRYLQYVKTSKEQKELEVQKPPLPVVDLLLSVKYKSNRSRDQRTITCFRINQDTRPSAYLSEVCEGSDPDFKRCQFVASAVDFSQPLRFELCDMTAGIPNTIGYKSIPILSSTTTSNTDVERDRSKITSI